MANGSCKKLQEKLLMQDIEPNGEMLEHIESCAECKAEYQKLCEMKELIRKSAPATPDLRNAVMSKIADQNISISPVPEQRSRRRIPLGTIAAAAAILVVYAAFYGNRVPTGNFSQNTKNDASHMIGSETAQEKGFLYKSKEYSTDDIAESEVYFSVTEELADCEAESVEYDGTAESYEEKKAPVLLLADAPQGKNEPELAAPLEAQKAEGTQETVLKAPVDGAEPTDDISNGRVTGSSGGMGVITEQNTNDAANGIPVSNDSAECAESIFETMEQRFPGRISRKAFEAVDAKAYIAFTESLEDPENGYTEQALAEFAASFAE